jgi:hypothetical protein
MAVVNGKPAPYKLMPRFSDAHFTADALAGEGILRGVIRRDRWQPSVHPVVVNVG